MQQTEIRDIIHQDVPRPNILGVRVSGIRDTTYQTRAHFRATATATCGTRPARRRRPWRYRGTTSGIGLSRYARKQITCQGLERLGNRFVCETETFRLVDFSYALRDCFGGDRLGSQRHQQKEPKFHDRAVERFRSKGNAVPRAPRCASSAVAWARWEFRRCWRTSSTRRCSTRR